MTSFRGDGQDLQRVDYALLQNGAVTLYWRLAYLEEDVTWLTAHGYHSALPEFSPHAKTWRWHTSVGTLRGRYDHLCYDAHLTPLRVEVRDAGRSDHLPVVGIFALSRENSPTTQRSVEQ